MERVNGLDYPCSQIDNFPTNGLTGIEDSLAYRINEVDRHLHHYVRAYGLAAVPAGETHRADEITSDPDPFIVDAGNDTWGAWVQIFGSADTPTGCVYYDPGDMNIVSVETANVVYLLQLAAGTSGAAGLAADTYSDAVFTPQSAAGRPAAFEYPMRRQAAGTKLWLRTLARGTNTAELGVYIDIHCYEG